MTTYKPDVMATYDMELTQGNISNNTLMAIYKPDLKELMATCKPDMKQTYGNI